MPVSPTYRTFVLEQLGRVTANVRSRGMFGGVGIYADDLFFGLIDDDQLYLKTDDLTKLDFEARGMGPFQPTGPGGETMAYHQLPEDILESPDELERWVARSLEVARASKAKRARKSSKPTDTTDIRQLLSGGDRRGIARSAEVRTLVEREPALVKDLAKLTGDKDWLVGQRALDLLEKLARDHPDWVSPHRRIFVGPLAESDKWEVRLQVVRGLPLFDWTPAQRKRVEAILLDNIDYPQTFVRAWALDSLATLSMDAPRLRPTVEKALKRFERSGSKALQARARNIRKRLKLSSVR